MKLLLIRPPEPMMRRATCTLGHLYLDGHPFCFTCEDVVRTPFVKVADKTAIPAGIYPVTMTFSPHFGKIMPEVLNVPNFTGIRIHPGNSELDTSGCILVGDTITMDTEKPLRNSLDAFGRLMLSLDHAASRNEEIAIEIKGTLP